MVILQCCIGQFPDRHSNSVMRGSALRINQGWVEESEKNNKKAERKLKRLIETDASYALRELAKITGISLSKVYFILKC